jgi:flagellar FliJ protein
MPTFRFRLQTVLELRQREHEQSQRALARAESDLRVAEHRLADAAMAVERANAELSAALRRPRPDLPLPWYRSWIAGLHQQRSACAQAVADREGECRKVRDAWWKTKRRVESMERLRDIQEDRWRHAAAADEQKQMDALATMKFAARQGLAERTTS